MIGRENAEITLDDDQVSRRHAVVREADGASTIEDCGSTNGTHLNGRRLASGSVTALEPGDEIRVGSTTLEVEGGSKRTVVASADATLMESTHQAEAPPAAPAVREPPAATFAVAAGPRRRIATRDLRVEALTFGAILATAVGLILYFALR